MHLGPLRSLRLKRGFSQMELAKLAETSQPQIDRLEKGERRLTRKWAERLAPHLGTDADELLGLKAEYDGYQNSEALQYIEIARNEFPERDKRWGNYWNAISEIESTINEIEDYKSQLALALTIHKLKNSFGKILNNESTVESVTNQKISVDQFIPLYDQLGWVFNNVKEEDIVKNKIIMSKIPFPSRFYDVTERPSFLNGSSKPYGFKSARNDMSPRMSYGDVAYVNPDIHIFDPDPEYPVDFLICTKDGDCFIRTVVTCDDHFIVCQTHKPSKRFEVKREDIAWAHAVVAVRYNFIGPDGEYALSEP